MHRTPNAARMLSGLVVALLALGAVPAVSAAPRAVVAGERHLVAGDIEPSKVLEYDFILRNEGDAMLAIEDLKPTCYCTSARTDLWDVPPGGAAKIHVRIDPSDFVGKINKGVEIVTNDPSNPVLLVDVDIHVLPGIAIVPPEVDFGAVGPEGSKKSLQVAVKVPRERNLQIIGASSDAPFLSVTHEPLELEEKQGATVLIKVLPGAPAGPFTAKVLVRTSDTSLAIARQSLADGAIEIPVRGRGPGGLRARPEKVIFEAASAGAEIGSFDVTGAKQLVVKSSVAGLQAELEAGTGESHRVRLRLATNARAGRLLAKVTVTTADGSQPELVVPVTGIVR